ncbi:hypothetical protein Tco_0777552 [Tanacetum coccineum]
MHGHGHLEFTKKLNDKIPKMMDDMFKRVKAFIRGEVAVGCSEIIRAPQWDKGGVQTEWSRNQDRTQGWSVQREFRRNMGTCAPYARRETFTPLTKTPKRYTSDGKRKLPTSAVVDRDSREAKLE